MKRKIIKQGHNTLTITIPSEWVKKLNLKAGDEIDMSEHENSLILNGHQNNERKCCTVDITDFTIPLLWRYFQSAYRSGYDEIKIVFDPNKKFYEDAFHYYTTHFDYAMLGEKISPKPAIVMIQEVVNRFSGINIMETGKNYCIVREVAQVSPEEFNNAIRRIFLVIFELFDKVIEAIDKNDIGHSSICRELHSIDLNIDTFVDACCRILAKYKGVVPENKKPLLFSSLFLLELVGDEFKYIGKHLALSKKPIKDCLKMAKLARDHFDMYYQLYYKFSREMAIKWGKNDVAIYKEHFNLKNKLHGDSRSIAKHLMMIGKLTLGLVELRIQMEF